MVEWEVVSGGVGGGEWWSGDGEWYFLCQSVSC